MTMKNSKALVGGLGESVDQTRHVKALDQVADLLTENARLTAALRKAEADRDSARTERDEANEQARQLRDAADQGIYRGNSMSHWYDKAHAYGTKANEYRLAKEAAESALATERTARESAEQLAVWAVRNCIGITRNGEMIVNDDYTIEIEHDGTDAGILAALRRAMEGEK